jgi:hypothetical protein
LILNYDCIFVVFVVDDVLISNDDFSVCRIQFIIDWKFLILRDEKDT